MDHGGNRSNLEQKIAWSLDRLSPENMQRVAEDLARISFGDRFPHFDGRALSYESRSRPWWPDAWVIRNSQTQGVEATIASTKSKVIKHLKEDLAKAQQRKDLYGLLFVSGHSEVQLSPSEITTWRQLFMKEGQLEWVELIFASRLVSELARPDFVQTRDSVLGISEHPSLFTRIRTTSMRPDGGRLSSKFIPTYEEYKQGRVHVPAAADQVRAKLDSHGYALVRGIGASGKSVLAWLLAQEAAGEGQAAYWFDLASHDNARLSTSITNELRSDLERFSYPRALFIIDNVHLDEDFARYVLDEWRVLAPRLQPRLLMLGRELRSSRGSPLQGAKENDVIPLKALQPEVLGVYRRLAWSKSGDQNPPEPSAAILDQWVATFGGDPQLLETTTDLIAFSAAVMQRLDLLLRGDWRLSEEDAIEEIREVYLQQLTNDELANIYRLSVMEQIDLILDEAALQFQRAGLRKSMNQLGLVFRFEVGSGITFVRYRLAHSALHRLILKASYEAIDPSAERILIARAYPLVGVSIVIRLFNLGQFQEAKRLAEEMLSSSAWKIELIPFRYITAFLIKSQQAGFIPPVSLLDDLSMPEARAALAKNSLQIPMHHLATQLGLLSKHGLSRITKNILCELSLTSNRDVIASKASCEPFGSLKSFLDYARDNQDLSSIYNTLADDLVRREYFPSLVQHALTCPVSELGDFLSYTTRFSELKPVYNYLTNVLSKHDSLDQLAHLLESQQLSSVVYALSSDLVAEIWKPAFELIDLQRWNQTRLRELRPNIDAFARFQNIAYKLQRIELAKAPALRLLSDSDPKSWHRPGVHLGQLSHVIRLAKEAADDDIEKFLSQIVKPEWLDALFNSEQTGGLAGSLQSLADNLQPKYWELFDRDSLKQRIIRELNNKCGSHSLATAFSLLGAAAAMNISAELKLVHWPSEQYLAELVEIRAPNPNRANIGPLQIQFWMGLREMARVRTDKICLPAEQAAHILALWRANRDDQKDFVLAHHAQDLNTNVISWLERCQAKDWRLQAP